MSNALVPFDAGQVPASVAAFLDKNAGNIAERTSVPSLSYEGKNWTVVLDGNKTLLTKKDADGEDVPVTVMRVTLLNYAKRRGRAYYEGAYNPNAVAQPDCWSNDGITPDPSVDQPKSSKCDTCPMAAKGSRVTDRNKEGVACSQHRMLAVVPGTNIDFSPLRLKIAITSDYDKNAKDQNDKGWFAFSGYMDFLRSRGVTHTGAVVTKIKFDTSTEYPKLFFSAAAWITDKPMLDKIAELSESPDVLKLLNNTYTPAGVNGTKVEKKGKELPEDNDEEEEEAVAPAPTPTPAAAPKAPKTPKTPPATAKAAPAPIADDDDEAVATAPVAEPEDATAKAAAVAKKAADKATAKKVAEKAAAEAQAAASKAAALADDDDGDDTPTPKPAKAPKTAPVAPKADVPQNVADIMGEWGD